MQGDCYAQHMLGVMYSCGAGVAEDRLEALAWFKKSAEQGDAEAQRKLGEMYYSEALSWFKKAARQGDAEAQRKLSRIVRN